MSTSMICLNFKVWPVKVLKGSVERNFSLLTEFFTFSTVLFIIWSNKLFEALCKLYYLLPSGIG